MNKKKIKKTTTILLSAEAAKLYEVNPYDDRGLYFHISPVSGRYFLGRKNQKYFDQKDKIAAAVAIRAERRSLPEKKRIARDKNDEILKKYYLQGDKPTLVLFLKQEGFDRNAPSTIHKSLFGKDIVFYKDYGCFFDYQARSVRIFRKSNDYKLYHNFKGDIYDFMK